MRLEILIREAEYSFIGITKPLTIEEKKLLIACQEIRCQNRDMVGEIITKADLIPTVFLYEQTL